ncbi:MAG: YicC/YloC family endoribonuclease [Simkaniaceae bacterium]
MLKSMTAYGRSQEGSFQVEVMGVNRKNFEAICYLPKEFLFLEMELRKQVKKVVSRGQISIRVTSLDSGKNLILPSLERVKSLKDHYDQLTTQLNIEEKIPLTFILNQLDSKLEGQPAGEDSALSIAVCKGLESALSDFLAMKLKEGDSLGKEILLHLKDAKSGLQKIEKLAEGLSEQLQKELLERYQKLTADASEDERVVKEAFLLIDKADIQEEIARLDSHFVQFDQIIHQEAKCHGKILDFLIQEMHREVSTILSKSSRINLTKEALLIKSSIEKMREQVQNIE